jgi:hypothetical protein
MEFEPVTTTIDAPSSQPEAPEQEQPAEKEPRDPASPPADETEGDKVAKGVQKRIDELTREKHEARRERDLIAQRAYEIDQQNAQMREFVRQQQLRASVPDPDQFNTPQEHYQATQQALAQYNQQRAYEQQQAQYAQAQQQAKAHEQAAVQGVLSKITQTYDDAAEVIGKLEVLDRTVQHHPAIRQAILASPQSADVLYYLGKNPAVAYEMATLDPFRAITKVGEIEAQLKAAKGAKPKADANVSTLSGGGGSNSEPKNIDDWMKWRNNQLKKRK